MHSATTQTYYEQVRTSIEFIVDHLDVRCTVEDVVTQAGFSRYHFQRIFRAMTGESVLELVRRLRLERAAYRLRHEGVSVLESALEAGYSSEEAFSRAFRRGCGISPSHYRTMWPPPTFASPTARVRFDPLQLLAAFDPPGGEVSLDVRVEALPGMRAAAIRHVGPYNEVGPQFERLLDWFAGSDVPTGQIFSMSYDDPDEMDCECLRSDACIEIQADVSLPADMSIRWIAGGRYAVFRVRGPYDGLPEAYRLVYGLWLPRSGEELDDRPCKEIYRNTPRDARPADLVTDLCLPLR